MFFNGWLRQPHRLFSYLALLRVSPEALQATLSALFSLTKGVTRNLGGFSLPIVYLFNLSIIYFLASIFKTLILQVLAPQMLTGKVRQCL